MLNVFSENTLALVYGKVDKYIYQKQMPDGGYAWAEVVNGKIVNGGRDEEPWDWNTENCKPGYGRLQKPGRAYPPMPVYHSRPPSPSGGGGGRSGPTNQAQVRASQPHPKIGITPEKKNFEEVLQQTKLTESYNATHRGNPIPAKGGSQGTIGGVACGVDYIEGLFDGIESVFGKDHYFCVPLIDGQIPFSQEQLRQILRELAIGIYAHGTVPFFSLHFNQNGDLFPVIHPAYQNTLVGRVISMLDYFMKGYLNGGVFSEEDVDNWNKPEESQPSWLGRVYNWWNPNQAASSGSKKPLDKLIDFKEYCKEHLQGKDKKYLSVKGMQRELQIKELLGGIATELKEPKELFDFNGFKNSFRIIAKQNSFQKEDNLFVIDADFDVLYTIEPSPIYQEKLEEYIREYGQMPASYINLIAIYKSMGKRIHDHMVKMPMCREYFSMLGVINFFYSYFSTLKKHRKIPELSTLEKIDARGCPPLFPHLPLTTLRKEVVKMNDYAVITNSLAALTFEEIGIIIPHVRQKKSLESFDRTRINEVFLRETKSNSLKLCSPAFKRYLLKDEKFFNIICERAAKWLVESMLNKFEQTVSAYYQIPQSRPLDERSLFSGLSAGICKTIPNQARVISREVPYNSLFAPNQVYAEDLEKNKKIVGGCGMRLEKKKIQSSSKASFVLENNDLPLDPETWEKVHMRDSEGAVFRLPLEDVPSGIIDDYSWRESLLIEERDPEAIQNWVEIQQAMQLGNHEEFKRCVNQIEDLTKIKGPNNTSLVHLAAKYNDDFYVRYLLDPVSTDLILTHKLQIG